jgi:hypothetical protein
MLTVVRRAMREVRLSDADAAAGELAIRYAREIDNGGELDKLGPKLLAALTALGMTPRARKAVVRDWPPTVPVSPLDELRQRRRSRAVD